MTFTLCRPVTVTSMCPWFPFSLRDLPAAAQATRKDGKGRRGWRFQAMKRAAGEATSAPMALALCARDSCAFCRFSGALTVIFASRAAKKKEILQGEAKKLEQRLRDRTAVLSQLRRHHEELLNVNGQLQ